MADDGTGGHGRPDRRQSRLSPRRLAQFATAHPGRVIAAWGVAVVVSILVIGGLLGGVLTGEGQVTNNPESQRAEKLID